MKSISKYAKKVVICLPLVTMIIFLVICASYQKRSEINEEDTEKDMYIELYEDTIEPAMHSDNVSTTIVAETDEYRSELRYAINGINSLVSYYKEEDGNVYLFELWNNMEQYYMRSTVDGVTKVYKVDVSDETRDALTSCTYSCYITVSSYLGVANKNRITSFEEVDDNTYKAVANLENAEYELVFTIRDGKLGNICMLNDAYADTNVNICFDDFNISAQSKYEDTEEVCDVAYVNEVFNYGSGE